MFGRVEVSFPPWPPGLPGTARLLEIMTAVGRDLGVEVRAIKTGGGSDGNHTSAIAPTLDGMGPKGNGAHSAEEFIEVATLLERTKMLALFLDRCAAEFAIAEEPQPDQPRRDDDIEILGSRSALEGERRQVTVLFADVRTSPRWPRSAIPRRFFELITTPCRAAWVASIRHRTGRPGP